MFEATPLSLNVVLSELQAYSQDGPSHFNEDFESSKQENSNYSRLIYMQDGRALLILDLFKHGEKYAIGFAENANITRHDN
jgi:hypothetical protein